THRAGSAMLCHILIALHGHDALTVPIGDRGQHPALRHTLRQLIGNRPASAPHVHAVRDVILKVSADPIGLDQVWRSRENRLPAMPADPFIPAVDLVRGYPAFDERLPGLPERSAPV